MRTLVLALSLAAAPALADVSCPAEGRCVPRARLSGVVDDDSARRVVDFLDAANEAGAEEALLELSTPGGSVSAGLEIIRAIEESDAPVTCVVDGDAESMGFAILQSCDRRLMTRRSKLMAHEPSMSGFTGGQPNEWAATAAMMAAEREVLAEQCRRRLRVSMDEYRRRTDGGQMWFMTWLAAGEFGAVDGVVAGAKREWRAMLAGRKTAKWAP